jgi:16S rRNA A1518/A1519 N6-dimethyltransferase RsmA/KsgA/DIM1 with predicted DNA glycosylase/AP lyase activity
MHKYDIELNADKPDVLNMMYDSCRNGSEILEVGCGNGRLTRRLCEKGCRVSIVEKDPILYGMASVYADEGICGDAMNVLPEAFLGRTFDYIIFAVVLEHL